MTTPPLHTCGKRMIPCMFGYPSAELLQMARRGDVKLMGCIIRDRNPPTHWCPYCKRYVYDQSRSG